MTPNNLSSTEEVLCVTWILWTQLISLIKTDKRLTVNYNKFCK